MTLHEHIDCWIDYEIELPYDGQYIISFSIDLYNEFPSMSGIIADRFNKEVWDKKDKKDKCDYWIADYELVNLLPTHIREKLMCCGDNG